MKRLTTEQAELLHHVELSQSGWPERALDQFVLSACLEASASLSTEDVRRAVAPYVETANTDQVSRSIQRLRSTKQLVELEAGRVSPSELARREAAEVHRHAASLEASAAEVWNRLVTPIAPGLELTLTWAWFSDQVLNPLIRTMGVRTYELLVAGVRDDDSGKTLLGFLDHVPGNQKAGARKAVEAFLGSAEPAPREYMLRQLHGHMLGLALGLPPGTVEAFQPGKKRVQLRLLLDTNFTFSLLGLHENPANEAAQEFLRLLPAVKKHVDVSLYATPLTIDEAKRTLRGYVSRFSDVQLTPRLGDVASSVDTGLSGIAVKFLDAAKSSRKRLTISEFLGPYLEDLVTVLRTHGIELYNENLDALSTSQPVVDDILAQQDHETRKTTRKAKSYEALRHDVTLWHLVSKRRPAKVDAPLDAIYWVVTIDFRYLGFDMYKRRSDPDGVPVCVHPAVLIQMLKLWLPRSERLDAALLGGLRASLPHSFDADAEEMTIRILRALSRYEDVDDIPATTVTSILMNRALRARMQAENEVQRQSELVRDEIVQAAKQTRADLDAERAKARELEQRLSVLAAESSAHTAMSSGQLQEARKESSRLQEQLEGERASAGQMERRLEALEAALASERAARTTERSSTVDALHRGVFLALAAFLLLGVVVAGWWLVPDLASRVGHRRALALSASGATALWLTFVVSIGLRLARVSRWPAFTRLLKAAHWIRNTAWILALGLAINALYDWLK